MSNDTKRVSFFRSPAHQCGYFADRQAEMVFAHPESQPDKSAQTVLANHGFRRSGRFIYRPACQGCSACIPVRIPAKSFVSSRNQKRVAKRNTDLKIILKRPDANDEVLALYQKYQAARHPGGQMVATDKQALTEFFGSPWSDTWFIEFRLDSQLVCIAIADRLDDAWSAVYTFFDPCFSKRSPGTLAILELIKLAQHQSLDWVYLGYWIAESPKMNYKNRFRPLQKFSEGKWQTLASIG